MLRGKVEVQSELGRGSTFRFVYPNVAITELAESTAAVADGEGDFAQFAPATILVADDVALNRQLAAGYFEGTEHKLITATNGREALEQAEKHRPDVILMDMRMPELDGYQATQRLKANAALKHIPVIAVTASSFREEEARQLVGMSLIHDDCREIRGDNYRDKSCDNRQYHRHLIPCPSLSIIIS